MSVPRNGAMVLAVLLAAQVTRAGELDSVLESISPDVKKWASVCRVVDAEGGPKFHWSHYRESAEAVDFWPASTIKVYTAIAALEMLNESNVPLDCVVTFERQVDGKWVLDTSRTMREMISEVFHRSSNEDYTLLLRAVGIDKINSVFLTPDRGFPHSALMRGYVLRRPYVYRRDEPQRITLHTLDGMRVVHEHKWTGTSYSEQRGATALSATTGNCTSTRELTDCLRRLFFHDQLSQQERFRLTNEQVRFLCEGGSGWTGLRNTKAGPYAWKGAAEKVFPDAVYYHKAGLISTYTLDTAYIHDEASGTRFFLTIAAKSGKTDTIAAMSRAICDWVKQTP